MRLRRTKYRDHACPCSVSAGPHVHGLGGDPDGVDTNHVGVDAVIDGYAGNRRFRLQAFLDDLGFERFGVRATLAHGNPGDKSNRVRLKYADTIILNTGVQ